MHSGGRVGVSDWYAGDIHQGIVQRDTAVYAGGRHVLPVYRPLQGALRCVRMTVVYAGGMYTSYTGRKLWSLTEPHGALASPESVELCLNVTNKCVSYRTEQVELSVEVG